MDGTDAMYPDAIRFTIIWKNPDNLLKKESDHGFYSDPSNDNTNLYIYIYILVLLTDCKPRFEIRKG